MSKPKGPTFQQIGDDFRAGSLGPNAVEAREYTIAGTYSKDNGRTEVDIICPFCGERITARTWSLAGGGKRCTCGALFGSRGMAWHWSDDEKRNKNRSST